MEPIRDWRTNEHGQRDDDYEDGGGRRRRQWKLSRGPNGGKFKFCGFGIGGGATRYGFKADPIY